MQKTQKFWLTAALIFTLLAAAAPFLWSAALPVCKTVHPQLSNSDPALSCSGSIIGAQTSRVSLNVPLCVKEVCVANGSSVSKGQKLLEVDREKMLALAAVGNDDSFAELLGDNYAEALSVLAGASGDESVALQSLPAAVYATDDGTVGDLSAQAGGILAADSTVCTISQGSTHQLRLIVPEDQMGQFSVGDQVVFSPIAYPDREYYGEVNDRTATVRRQLTTTGYKSVADIYVTVAAADEFLADGMSVTATVKLPSKEGLLTVPYEAVAQDDAGEYVWKIQNGRASRQAIVTGTELDDRVEVTSGLSLQDSILLDASETIKEGQLVKAQ